MKVKFGAIITEGRGKINGFVASRNAAGAYFRTKVTPTNPATAAQALIKARLSAISQAWRSLTDAQRIAWNFAVSDYQRTDIFGDLKSPTGFNLYQRINNNLAICGIAPLTVPALPAAVPNISDATLTISNAGNTITAAITTAIDATVNIKVFATAPMSPGKSFVKSEFRLIDVLDDSATTPISLTTAYCLKFGSVGEVDQKIFIKTVPVNITTGQTGVGIISSGLVAA